MLARLHGHWHSLHAEFIPTTAFPTIGADLSANHRESNMAKAKKAKASKKGMQITVKWNTCNGAKQVSSRFAKRLSCSPGTSFDGRAFFRPAQATLRRTI